MACLSAQMSEVESNVATEIPSSPIGSALRRVRKVRAFGGKAEQQNCQTSTQSLDVVSCGLSQVALDALSVHEVDVQEEDEVEGLLLRARRIRAFLGADEANAFAAANSIDAKDLDQDRLTSVGSTHALPSSFSRQSSQDGLSQAALDAMSITDADAEILAAQSDATNGGGGLSQSMLDSLSVRFQATTGEESVAEPSSPGPDVDLLRIRRTRAFQGDAAASALITQAREQHVGETANALPTLLSPTCAGKTQEQLDKLCEDCPCSPSSGVEQVATPQRKRRSFLRQSNSPEHAAA